MFEYLQGLMEAKAAGLIRDVKFEIEGDQLHAYIKPIKPVEFIRFNFTAIRSNVTFEEITGSNNAIRNE